MSGKKKDRKKARAEIQDRFEGNLKHATKKDPQKQPQPLPPAAIAPQTAPQPATATQAPGTPQAGAPAPAQQNLPQAPAQRPRQKLSVADLVKGKIKYKGDLTPIVYKYLLRSYPAKVIDWVQDTKGADWEYDPHVKLSDINMARRPGGRDPEKVASIANTLSDGASLDPIVLVDAGNPNGLEIADGWHRALGAEKAGLDDLPAFIGEGFGDDQGLDAPWGTAMQDASSSVKKAALAEVAVLRRFLRKGGDVTSFTTTAIDPDVMKTLTADLATMDRDAALDKARDLIAHGSAKSISLDAPLDTGVVPFDLSGEAAPAKCPQCGLTLDDDGLCPTHGTAVSKRQAADNMLAAVEAELLKRGVNPLTLGDDDATLTKYSADQPRDADGKFGSGGASADPLVETVRDSETP
jgi:hypothetical protein